MQKLQSLSRAVALGAALAPSNGSLPGTEIAAGKEQAGLTEALSQELLTPKINIQEVRKRLAANTSPITTVAFTQPREQKTAGSEPRNNAQEKALDLDAPEVKSILEKLDVQKPETIRGIPPEYLNDRGFVKEAARIAPSVIEQASAELKNDTDFLREVMIHKQGNITRFYSDVLEYVQQKHRDNENFMRALQDDGIGAYNLASPRLRSDQAFLRHAASSHVTVHLDQIPPNLRRDNALMRDVIRDVRAHLPGDSKLSNILPSEVVKDKEFWLAAANRNSELYHHLPLSLQNDKEFLIEAVKTSPYVYSSLPQKAQEDRNLAEVLCRTSPASVCDLTKNLLEDRIFIASQLRRDGSGFSFLPDKHRADPTLILAAARNNAGIIADVEPRVLQAHPELVRELATISYNTQGPLKQALGTLPEEVTTIYDRTEKALQLLGFSENTYRPRSNEASLLGKTQQGRFDATQEIIRNRWEVAPREVQRELEGLLGFGYFSGLPDINDKRSRVAVLLPHSDENGAFDQREGIFHSVDLVDQVVGENKALVYEMSSQDDLIKARNEIVSRGAVDSLVMGAHGSATAMSFGGVDPREKTVRPGDKRFLTMYDTDIFKQLNGLVKDGGNVILMSCSTGGVTEGGKNVAAAFHAALPHTTVYAPTEPTTVVRIVDPLTGRIKEPLFSVGLQQIRSFIAPAQEPVTFDVAGLDDDTAHAVEHTLSKVNFPYSFKLAQRDGQHFVEMANFEGTPQGFYSFDPRAQIATPIGGTELSTKAAAALIRQRTFDVLTHGSTLRLWRDCMKAPSEQGYIGPNDQLLIATQDKLASELGLDSSDMRIRLSLIPGGAFHGAVDIQEGSTSKRLVSFTATAGRQGNLVMLTDEDVDLELLGRSLKK